MNVLVCMSMVYEPDEPDATPRKPTPTVTSAQIEAGPPNLSASPAYSAPPATPVRHTSRNGSTLVHTVSNASFQSTVSHGEPRGLAGLSSRPGTDRTVSAPVREPRGLAGLSSRPGPDGPDRTVSAPVRPGDFEQPVAPRGPDGPDRTVSAPVRAGDFQQPVAPQIPPVVVIAFQNTDGWRSCAKKRMILGQQFQGTQSTTKKAGYDISAYAEVHCNGHDDVKKYANDVNPKGRTYFTWWLAVCVGPTLNGTPVHATTYGGGRAIRLDLQLEGRQRTYVFVYVPVERDDRPAWLSSFPLCMPASRDVLVVGDFNTRMSTKDHVQGRPPTDGEDIG